MRLSRKASETAGKMTAHLEGSVRKIAAQIAEDAGREAAEAKDVKEAYRLIILTVARRFGAVVDEPLLHDMPRSQCPACRGTGVISQ